MGKIFDKYGLFIALGVMVAMMALYQWQDARNAIAGVVDVIISPFVAMGLPFFALVLILSTITGFYSSILQKYTIDYEEMMKSSEKMREFQMKFREAQKMGDERLIKKLQAQQALMMKDQMKGFQNQFKPMMWILILTIPIFFWLYKYVDEHALSETTLNMYPQLADLTNAFVIPFGGLTSYSTWIVFPVWLIWYLICSLCMTQIIRKALNIGSM